MRIVDIYSHHNAHEHMQVHAAEAWKEIELAIENSQCPQSVPLFDNGKGEKAVHRISDIVSSFNQALFPFGWEYYKLHQLVKLSNSLSIKTSRYLDYIKGRTSLALGFSSSANVVYDVNIRHLTLFTEGVIDVGIEIVPMIEMQRYLSHRVTNFGDELCNLIRQGPCAPSVPIVLVGVDL